jgi:hypothetical protein
MKTALASAALLLCACGRTKPPAAVETKPAVEYFQVDPATAATVQGKVTFEGKRPAARRISMDAEEACEKLHKTPVLEELVSTAKDGGLANALVYVKSGLEGKHFPTPQQAVVLDQTGCQFVPRVIAVQAGQMLEVKNSDPVSHNIHPMPKNNRDWNQQQPPGSPDLKRRFAYPEVMIPVKCNVHNWMRTYIGVIEHPYFAVTTDKGEFKLDNLPPGEYTIAVWHEAADEQTQKIVLTAHSQADANFRIHPR